MERIQIMVAAMKVMDEISFSDTMRIATDVVIANQCDSVNYRRIEQGDHTIETVSTALRGVGKNRNTALVYSTGDILVCADDDCVYHDNYEKVIREAYARLPDADFIVFNVARTDTEKESKRIRKIHRVRQWNYMRYGTVSFTFRKESVQKANIWFSELFGGGAKYSCGEDTLFLCEALKKGLTVYAYPACIVTAQDDTSTWFVGYNDKYIYDRGVLIRTCFPVAYFPVLLIMATRYMKKSNMSYSQVLKLLISGAMEWKKQNRSRVTR